MTSAFVLDFRSVSDNDALVTLYTKEGGLMRARMKSGYSLTSKLMPHLQTTGPVIVRLVEKNTLRLTDALSGVDSSQYPLSAERMSLFSLLCDVVSTDIFDAEIWMLLMNPDSTVHDAFTVLGLNHSHAHCGHCGSPTIDYFCAPLEQFYCARCSLSLSFISGMYSL